MVFTGIALELEWYILSQSESDVYWGSESREGPSARNWGLVGGDSWSECAPGGEKKRQMVGVKDCPSRMWDPVELRSLVAERYPVVRVKGRTERGFGTGGKGTLVPGWRPGWVQEEEQVGLAVERMLLAKMRQLGMGKWKITRAQGEGGLWGRGTGHW